MFCGRVCWAVVEDIYCRASMCYTLSSTIQHFRVCLQVCWIRHGNLHERLLLFDELMKVYINIKNIRGLYPHQVFNKRVWLMKRESRHSGRHHFSFGERFDERMLSVHYNGFQCIKSLIHQFIGFSPLIKSAGEATEVNTAIRRLVGWTSVLPTDKENQCCWRKEKGDQYLPTPPQVFEKQKAIAR